MPQAKVNGHSIYYSALGKGGMPVVFVHGAAGSHLVWGLQVRALGECARAIALDLPGHGRSDPPGRTAIEGYRDVVLGLLDSQSFDRAVIVGHSMGSAVAQTMALSHPDRVAGLGLVGAGARLRVLPAILEGVRQDLSGTAALVVDYSYAPGLDAHTRNRAIREFCACAPEVIYGDFAACNAFDVMAQVSTIRAPTVVICGRQDRMTPVKYSEFLASRIPNARLVLVEGAGHSVMMERADEVNRALMDFVKAL